MFFTDQRSDDATARQTGGLGEFDQEAPFDAGNLEGTLFATNQYHHNQPPQKKAQREAPLVGGSAKRSASCVLWVGELARVDLSCDDQHVRSLYEIELTRQYRKRRAALLFQTPKMSVFHKVTRA
jgi:hypothetical protein